MRFPTGLSKIRGCVRCGTCEWPKRSSISDTNFNHRAKSAIRRQSNLWQKLGSISLISCGDKPAHSHSEPCFSIRHPHGRTFSIAMQRTGEPGATFN